MDSRLHDTNRTSASVHYVQTKREEWLAIAALFFATLAWGSTFVLVKDGISKMPLLDLMAWRWLIASVVLIAIRPRVLRADRTTMLRGAAIGAITFIGYVTQTIGLQTVSASVSGFITGMFVVFTPLFGWLFLRERLTGGVWLSVVLAVVGLGFLSLRGWSVGAGELWTLAGAAMWALQILLLALWATRENAATLATMQLSTTAVLFLVTGTVDGGLEMPPSTDVWIAIWVLAIFGSVFAFTLQAWGQSHLDATRAAVIFTFEPVFASVFGVWFGGDQITTRFLIGAGFILVAMLVSELAPKRAVTQTSGTPRVAP